MPKRAIIPNRLNSAEKKRLRELEARYDIIWDKLYNDPSNSQLSLELRLIEVDIIRITGEETIGY